MTGYIIHYTDRDGEKTVTTVADSDELSLTIDHCGENVNINIAALSQHLPSEPQGYVYDCINTIVTFNIDIS